jgi:manganese oxidase
MDHTFLTTRRPAGDPRDGRRTRRFRGLRTVLIAVSVGAIAVALFVTSAPARSAHQHPLLGNDSVPAPPTGAIAPTYPGGQVRTYYIAADRVAWDYAPTHRNQITGKKFDPIAKVFVKRGVGRIGSKYLKSLYRQYTDGTFKQLALVPPQWRHLGFLGPMIQAEVGDTIVVHFKNNTPFPTGMHPHGVRYAKESEGALYNDGTSGADKADDAVKPGHEHTYVWQVPERSGPGPGDQSSVMWMYHGHTDEVLDTYAGLIGPMIITKRGMARPDGSPIDVDREFVSLFEVADENQSPWLNRNIRRYAKLPKATLKRHSRRKRIKFELSHLPGDEGFGESNLMHSINGYVYGNGPVFEMNRGERVRWYVMGMGTEVDLHTPHWHGNVITTNMGMRTDTVPLLPGTMVQGDMDPDDPGTWLFHCHVNDHIVAGMIARYKVN